MTADFSAEKVQHVILRSRLMKDGQMIADAIIDL